MSPVALRIQIAELEVRELAQRDFRNRPSYLARDEILAPPRRFVIEENAVARKHFIRLAIVDDDPKAVQLRTCCLRWSNILVEVATAREMLRTYRKAIGGRKAFSHSAASRSLFRTARRCSPDRIWSSLPSRTCEPHRATSACPPRPLRRCTRSDRTTLWRGSARPDYKSRPAWSPRWFWWGCCCPSCLRSAASFCPLGGSLDRRTGARCASCWTCSRAGWPRGPCSPSAATAQLNTIRPKEVVSNGWERIWSHLYVLACPVMPVIRATFCAPFTSLFTALELLAASILSPYLVCPISIISEISQFVSNSNPLESPDKRLHSFVATLMALSVNYQCSLTFGLDAITPKSTKLWQLNQ